MDLPAVPDPADHLSWQQYDHRVSTEHLVSTAFLSLLIIAQEKEHRLILSLLILYYPNQVCTDFYHL